MSKTKKIVSTPEEQAWDTLMKIADDYVLILGASTVSPKPLITKQIDKAKLDLMAAIAGFKKLMIQAPAIKMKRKISKKSRRNLS